MDSLTVFIYGALPYISLLLLVGGVIYRFAGWLSPGCTQ